MLFENEKFKQNTGFNKAVEEAGEGGEGGGSLSQEIEDLKTTVDALQSKVNELESKIDNP